LSTTSDSSQRITSNPNWWKEAIIYQIYPRSFKDSHGDGTGDLKGILQKIDYIQSLGIDTIWLNPIYPSPNDDGGYDISDYTGIQPEFGDMQDFDALLKAFHDRGIRLIMDLVLNHSSDEHPWFVESRKSKDNPYRDYYFWRPGVNGGPPNNWTSFFGGSAWQLDEETNEYYLHLFSKKQPDLNWENKNVREEIKKLMRFWLDKGVDGLRLDVISLISKRTDFPNADTSDFPATIREFYANGPRVKEFLSEMRSEVWDQYSTFTIGEGPGITAEGALDYLDPEKGLKLIFHFDHMILDQGPGGRFDPVPWKLDDFKFIFKKWDEAFADDGWASVFLGNHDYPRMVSRWGDDGEYRVESAKMLITLLLCMRGTPFIFQGDEIGMTNLTLNSISDSKDIETINSWAQAKKNGMREEEFLAIANKMGRDNARTPMQWNDDLHAGFTSAEPWMKLNANHAEINVADQEKNSDSILNYFRQMISLRKSNPVLVYGSFELIDTRETPLFVFHRILNEEKWTVVLNFSSQEIPFNFSKSEEKIFGNYPTDDLSIIRPWESVVNRKKLSVG
jgi:oligo-1,6-glucosidase